MSTKKKRKEEEEEGNGGMAEALEQDALLAILQLLPARALASAACVCRSWFHGVQAICSRPCMFSALSLRLNLESATKEVLEKVLEQPFRPQFAIVFASQRFKLSKIFEMLKKNLPGGIVVIGCHAAGLIGLDVATNKHKEVVFRQSSSSRLNNTGLVVTLGCLPGVRVEALTIKNSYLEDDVKNFVDQAGTGSFHGSRCESPLSIVLLAKPRSNINNLLEKLEESKFIRCQVATSGGLVPVGPVYFVVSVRETKDPVLQEETTWLTCIREGDDKELDGLSLLEDLHAPVGGDNSYLCVGIMQHRRRSAQIGQRGVFHLYEVQGADEQYLYIDGKGVKTGDKLRFYHTDAKAARLENMQKLNHLKQNMKSGAGAGAGPSNARPWKPGKPSEVGALMFSCIVRGNEFFHEENVDSSDFLERFPAATLSGMFCLGEIGPPSTLPWEVKKFSKQQRQAVKNMFSTIFMLYSQFEGGE